MKWIDAGEHLPQEDDVYLCVCLFESPTGSIRRIRMRDYEEGEFVKIPSEQVRESITHWIKIPALPPEKVFYPSSIKDELLHQARQNLVNSKWKGATALIADIDEVIEGIWDVRTQEAYPL